MTWTLDIRGEPKPKGSWTPVPAGRAVIVAGEARYRLRDIRLKADNRDSLRKWLHAIELAILEAGRPREPVGGSISIKAVFRLSRPQQPKNPSRPITRPDLDKLARALGDALSGIYYVDDSQVTDWLLSKRYATALEPPGCSVMIAVDGEEQINLDF